MYSDEQTTSPEAKTNAQTQKRTMATGEDYETEEEKQAAADILFNYSKFVMEVSGLPTTVKKETTQVEASPDPMGESSSSGLVRLEKAESFQTI